MPHIKKSEAEELLQSITVLINTYAETHPQVSKDLEAVRVSMQATFDRGEWRAFAALSLRLASAIKFISDHLPPPH